MHPDPAYPITTIPAAQPPPLHLSPGIHPLMPTHEIPPGIEMVTLPGGARTLAYTQPPVAPPISPQAPAVQPIPTWAKTTALLVPTVGGGIAIAGIGLSYAAPGLIAMSSALWSAVGLIAAITLGAGGLLWHTRRHTTPPPAQINQHITATGPFGRANGTINHR